MAACHIFVEAYKLKKNVEYKRLKFIFFYTQNRLLLVQLKGNCLKGDFK